MVWTIVVVLLLLWALGFFGGPAWGWYGAGATAPYWLHLILVIVVVAILFQLLTGRRAV